MMVQKHLVAVVLAGGVGRRFWPLTTNKILFPFFGTPFIAHSVVHTLPREVSKVVVVANAENRETIKEISFPVRAVTVLQRNALGMADALLSAAEEIHGSRLLIFIADDLVDGSLFDEILAKANTSRAFGVLPGWKAPHAFHGGYFVTSGTRISGIIEKPPPGTEPSPYVAITGHYIADADTLLAQIALTKSEHDDVYEKALSALMKHQDFEMVPYEGAYATLKYPWDVLPCMDQLLDGYKNRKGKNVVIGDGVTIEGDVVIEDNVRIMEHTKITGPCFIGEGSIIGNNNLIRASHIGKQCVTGFSTDITRSYVGDNCWFHSNYIGDSVIEKNVSLGAGSVLANLRLDEGAITSRVNEQTVETFRHKLGAVIGRDVRIGVNASIMPGVKIGSRTFIGAGVTIHQDIADECFVTDKRTYSVSKNLRAVLPDRDVFKKQL